ncbi:hypothetical protein [Fluviicola sp.]|uniref:hypothetical protein n=1 Tax=Fluviicola sp. TaxID=1917219 RepID=UPI0026024437|nr:hypothetical protein [Fluviicola sp.]
MKFDRKSLPQELKILLDSKGIAQAYSISTTISEWLEVHPDPDMNTLLCAAHYAWECARLTELDDDIIDFGEEAIGLLERVLILDPRHEEALKQKSKIQKKVKKAQRGREEVLRWEQKGFHETNRGVLDEVAFYYFEKATKNPEFAAKGYRYYQQIYAYDLLEAELPRDALYHFATMAYCKFYAEGYEAAKALIEKTLAWELNEKYKIYDFKVTDVWVIEWSQLANQDNFQAFEASFRRWYEKMKAISPDKEPDSFDYSNLNPVVKWLMTKPEGKIVLQYILEHCYPFLAKKKIDLNNYPLVLETIEQRR